MKTTGNSSPLAACSVIIVTQIGFRFPVVDVGHQRRLLQKRLEATVFGMRFVEFAGVGQQFVDVLQTLLIFFRVGNLQPLR